MLYFTESYQLIITLSALDSQSDIRPRCSSLTLNLEKKF